MKLFKLQPAYKDYLWGGTKLRSEYGKTDAPARTAESWELSCHPDGECVVRGGIYDSQTLSSIIAADKSLLGTRCADSDSFPIMIKLIDAKDNLSIQVHPNDEFAKVHEGQLGKTEMWYILEHEEGASLYFGMKKSMTREDFAASIIDGSVVDALNKVTVKKGDVFFIEPGTVHAIGKGILLAEIQQSSNVTYRLYDFGRLDHGQPRVLHIDKGTACSNLNPPTINKPEEGYIATCPFFSVKSLAVDKTAEDYVSDSSFHALLFLSGSGSVVCGDERVSFDKGDCIFIAANAGSYLIDGNCELLTTFVGLPE